MFEDVSDWDDTDADAEASADQEMIWEYLDAMGYDNGDDDVDSYDADESYGFQPWGGDLPN
jgi:hypothetical protein